MTSKAPEAPESDMENEDFESILRRAEALAKEVEGMQECPRRRRLRNALSAIQTIGGEPRTGIRDAD
jgi:hypothetical protein